MKVFDLIIIGAGPAGLAAAIYAKRANINFLIIEKGTPGGKLVNTNSVENFPGLPFITGGGLATEFYNHATNLDVKFEFDEVVKINDIDQKVKEVVLKSDKKLKTKTIILASGMDPMKLKMDNYDKFLGNGISTCIVCDGALYKGKDIAIIGGGNSAIEESIFASKIVKNIYIINIANDLTAFPSIVETFRRLKNVKEFNNSELIKINGEDKIESITIKNNKTSKIQDLKVDGIFTYIGWIPSINMLNKDSSLLTNEKFIKVNMLTNETKIPGIFSAGDVVDKKYRQITNAVSDGTNAALSAKKYLDNL